VRGARIIPGDETTQEETISSVKTHEEILELFKEIEDIETRFKTPIALEEPTLELVPTPDGELIEIQPSPEKPSKKHQKLFSKSKQKKPKEPTTKHFLKKKKNIPGEIQDLTPKTRLFKHWKHNAEKQIHPTFSLKLDAEGNLVGLNIKKPKPPKEKKAGRFRLRRKKGEGEPAAAPEPEAPPEPGIKGKLKRVVKKLKPGRKAKKEGSSKFAALGKIKGIVKRKK
jgi:hypothetical protein